MSFFSKRYYELLLGGVAVFLFGLLIIYLVLAMMSITSGIGRAIGPSDRQAGSVGFNLDAAATLGLD